MTIIAVKQKKKVKRASRSKKKSTGDRLLRLATALSV